jgi:predicted DNA-binding transcriptional regulator YafY
MLDREGVHATMRMVQRDLEALSSMGIFGIDADKSSKPTGWYWLRHARKLQIPYMDINTAIAFSLFEAQSKNLLPAAVRDQIKPYFKQSHEILKERNNWSEKISLGRSARSGEYSINPKCRDLVYQALDEGKCLSAEIGRFYRGSEMDYMTYSPLHPIGLRVEQDDIYLIAHAGNPKKPLWFALYRFKDVEILDQDTDTSETYDLDALCRAKAGDTYRSNITVELEVGPGALQEMLLYPIGDHQTVTSRPQNKHIIVVQTDESPGLRRRLLSLGSSVTVLQPRSLVAYIQKEAKKVAEAYTRNPEAKELITLKLSNTKGIDRAS